MGDRAIAEAEVKIAAEFVHELSVVKLTDGRRNAQGQRPSAEVNPARRVSAFGLQRFLTSPVASAP
jgi:hypothetical protein